MVIVTHIPHKVPVIQQTVTTANFIIIDILFSSLIPATIFSTLLVNNSTSKNHTGVPTLQTSANPWIVNFQE